jgi:YHS domain-containing protein
VAAIILAIGIPAATIANRQWAAKDHKATAAKTDACCPAEESASGASAPKDGASCPAEKPASDASAMKDGASCPYMAEMDGKTPAHSTAKPVTAAKPATADEVKQCPAASITAPKVTPQKPAEKKVVSAVCPVMKERIPDVTKAAGHSVYKGKTYYFCCPGCKPLFDKDPTKYLSQ